MLKTKGFKDRRCTYKKTGSSHLNLRTYGYRSFSVNDNDNDNDNDNNKQMYRFNEKLIKFMRTSMSNWKTTMKLSYNDGCITTDQIKIKRGIFQGDSFSPLLFCLALVPLTSELATSGYGYKILNTSAPISNLFYMDDVKLYSKNEQEQVGELKIVKQFSDIGMEFGLEKCAKASFKKGKLASTGNVVIDEDTEIQELDQEGVYKYLDVDEIDGIQHSKMKEKIKKEYNRRVRLILRTELNGSCLLYTSPSPRDGLLSRMPSSA